MGRGDSFEKNPNGSAEWLFDDRPRIDTQQVYDNTSCQLFVRPVEPYPHIGGDTCYRCWQYSFWIKYCLFVINFLVLVGGICLLIIGAWARFQKAQLDSLDNLMLDPAFFIVAVSCVMLAVGVFGCLGSLRENICFLKTFCVVIAVVFLLEVVTGILAFTIIDYVRDRLEQYLLTAVKYYADEKSYREAIDYVQFRFQCCGAFGYNDWEYNLYYNCSSPAQSHCGVPRSCCKITSNDQCGFQTRIEGELYAAHMIHTRGCVELLVTVFRDHLIVIAFIAFGVGFVELFAILLAHSLITEVSAAQRVSTEKTRLPLTMRQHYESTQDIHHDQIP